MKSNVCSLTQRRENIDHLFQSLVLPKIPYMHLQLIYFRLFGQYHLCNSRVVVISANLSLSRAICEWNEYKLCAD